MGAALCIASTFIPGQFADKVTYMGSEQLKSGEATPSQKEIEEDAFQADRDARVPKVWKICVCRGGEVGRGTQVAHWLLQVLHVQQDVGQHQLQRKRLCFVLQGVLRT